MAERIELPPQLQGDEKRQLQQLWSYLYQLSESINNNLEGIGSNELTDAERATMKAIVGEGERQGLSEMESLKSLIIKTADFVQTSLTEYRLNLLGSTVASGQFGRYVRNTGLDVAVTPEGITQNYSFEEVVQGLKEFSINAKNYIKTGLLRVVDNIPVYGVAIGKDVVTFSQDGTETYNDGNKVAELTADELSFWQNGVKVAGYTGNRISFYYGGTEVFYIASGKLYCAQDLEIVSGKKLIISTDNFSIDENGNATFGGDLDGATGTFSGMIKSGNIEFGNYYDKDTNANAGVYAGQIILVPGQPEFTGAIILKTSYSDETLYKTTEMRFRTDGWGYSIIDFESEKSQIGQPNVYLGYIYVKKVYLKDYIYAADSSVGVVLQLPTSQTLTFVAGDDVHGYSSIYRLIPDGPAAEFRIGDSAHKFTRGYFDQVWYGTLNQNSSREVKHYINKMESMGSRLDKLRPVTFVYNEDKNERQRFGLVYEETVNVMPEICTDRGDAKAINYVELIPMLLKEIQDLRARVRTLEERTGG